MNENTQIVTLNLQLFYVAKTCNRTKFTKEVQFNIKCANCFYQRISRLGIRFVAVRHYIYFYKKVKRLCNNFLQKGFTF